MKDHFGRNINYLRLSITDRCNLRCKYCMPHGVEFTPHEQILTYEEFLRVARAAVHLGIPRFKITGGEPLVRKGVTDFIAALKRLPGVEEVTLTTNGVRLAEMVPALKAAGVDGVNIFMPTVTEESYRELVAAVDELHPPFLCLQDTKDNELRAPFVKSMFDEFESFRCIKSRLPIRGRIIPPF